MEKIDRELALALIEAELTALLLMVPMYKRMGAQSAARQCACRIAVLHSCIRTK